MSPPLAHPQRRLLSAGPNLLAPRFFRSFSSAAVPAARRPTTAVAVLWDLAASRPPSTLPLYDAAVRLHLAATSFGRLRLSAAFVHPSHRLPAPAASAATTYPCRVCGRRFRARDSLLRHFDAIHAREHAKRLARIDSSRGGRRVRLAAELSLKLSKYEKAARELTAGAGTASPSDELGRAGVRVELSRTPAASLHEHAQLVLDEGSARCLMLVSGHEELAPLLRVAREKGVRSVVVGGESRLARWADVGFSWAEVIAGKARKAAPSVSGKWRDGDVLKGLEWRYEDEDGEEEVVFEDSDADGVEELARKAKGKPWWKMDSDIVANAGVSCAVRRRLGVLGSHCPPAFGRNAAEGFLPSVGFPSPFRRVVVQSGNLLGSPRFCHATASMPDRLTDVYASEILKVLKSTSADNVDLSDALRRFAARMDEDVILTVLQKQRSNWQVALAFFNWAATLPGYAHGSRAYTEMLDILGRMKKVRHMRQLFDEIPEERRVVVVTNKMFAVLLNRYAGAHKVQEAIEVFYLRKDYGFELDLVGFQILLMSLCRYKHVEEAEALFREKKDEFPHVTKSWNNILNGWCVKGSWRDAQRIWNDIIAFEVERDLFSYGTFINALAKNGRISAAVKLFKKMWEEGINPDVAICNCIIDQLCFKKRIPEALEIFGEMNDRLCQADVATYNTLIKYLCKIKRMEKVYELLDDMEPKGCSPNNRTYSYILKTTEKPKDVIALMQRMEQTGCTLDSDTYNLILNLYINWKYEKGVQQVWDEMERRGSGPDQRSFIIMVHGLHSQGKLDEALQYYPAMKSRGMIPEPRTKILVKAMHMKKGKLDP